jgi:uncharacterized protein YhaN
MTNTSSSYKGPYLLSDLLAEIRCVRQKQQSAAEKMAKIEEKYAQLHEEHAKCGERIDELESRLREIAGEKKELENNVEKVRLAQVAEESRRIGQRVVLTVVVLTVAPFVIAFLSWWVPETLKAIRHALVEEEAWRMRQDPYKPNIGPPVIPRPQKKP